MADEKPKQDEPRYTVEELQARARTSFSVAPYVVFGALSGESRKSWTLGEAQKKIDSFLKRPVKTEAEQEPEAEEAEATA